MTMDSTAMMCQATTKSGATCRHLALPDLRFCWWHDPSKADERREARSRGGRARHGRKLGDDLQAPIKIRDLGDVVRVVVEEINIVRSLEKSISRSRAVGYLCNILIGAYQASELELRIAALEQAAQRV